MVSNISQSAVSAGMLIPKNPSLFKGQPTELITQLVDKPLAHVRYVPKCHLTPASSVSFICRYRVKEIDTERWI